MAGSIKFYFISVGGRFGLFMEKPKALMFCVASCKTIFIYFFLSFLYVKYNTKLKIISWIKKDFI